MTPERWQQVSRVYQSALERAPATRGAFVADACRDDSDLRREVESLLAREHAHVMVDDPVDAAAAALMGAPSLAAGSMIGPYRVTTLIGEGGMGQVYRAHDTKLQREVALKILAESFLYDPDRLARFTREAHVLASLNHPNIGAIHGFEDSGPVHALVLELVEGPTLADRIARGPIPLDEALPIARQIAEALEAAHEHGIVHRDLKPANIKVREDGTVKVLDFGLAKLTDANTATASNDPNVRTIRTSPLTHSPTVMSPAMTAMGVILGTAAYMSPEQAKGKPADKRSDIWAFGCVLYEMLTGKRAFDGDDVSDTLAAVLRADPDWTLLPEVPQSLRSLLQTCLQKDRRKRTADATTAVFVLNSSFDAQLSRGDETVTTARASVRRTIWWVIGAAVAAAAITGVSAWVILRPQSPRVARLSVLPSDGPPLFTGNTGRHLAISRDGSRLVYTTGSAVDPRLFVRPLDQLEPTFLAQGAQPFLSPDGQSIGFFEPGSVQLKTVAVTGGPAIAVTQLDGAPRGGTWGDDGAIIFSTGGGITSGLKRVSASGGDPVVLTRPNVQTAQSGHFWPHFLPGARAVLFTIV
jgi:serine/threonine-protein kinase